MEQIIITPTLDIHYSDLSLKIDLDHPFVLKDLLRASVSSSEIPIPEMTKLVHCDFIQELWEEAENNTYEPFLNAKVDHMLLTYCVETFPSDGTNFCDAYWELSGADNKGRALINLEMSPTYRLSELPIRISPKSEWYEFCEKDIQTRLVKYHPPITLLDMLNAIYWHLSLFGSPSQREERIDQFVEAVRSLYHNQKPNAAVEAIKHPLETKD
jgi:hypothetical protein